MISLVCLTSVSSFHLVHARLYINWHYLLLLQGLFMKLHPHPHWNISVSSQLKCPRIFALAVVSAQNAPPDKVMWCISHLLQSSGHLFSSQQFLKTKYKIAVSSQPVFFCFILFFSVVVFSMRNIMCVNF